MKRHSFTFVLALLLFGAVCPIYAQKGGGVEVSIKKIDLKDQVTPQYRESQHGSQGGKERWLRVDVEFDTKGKKDWINELEVRWLVAIQTDNNKVAGLTQTVTYLDVETERGHNICTYVSPKFFRKYFRSKRIENTKISVYVEFYIDGVRVAREERPTPEMQRVNGKWYNNLDKMVSFPNALLPRNKTPFAPLDFDYYEYEKIN